MKFSCLDLPPFGPCGFAGTCEVNETSFSEYCHCDKGWSQTRELMLFFITEEEFEKGIGVCNSNFSLYLWLYVLVGLSGAVALCFHAYYIRTKNELLHFFPSIISLTLQTILSLYRLANLETALFAHDPLVSFLVENSACWAFIAITVFMQRYFKHAQQRMRAKNSEAAVKFHYRCVNVLAGLAFITYQTIFFVTLSPRVEVIGVVMIKIASVVIFMKVVLYGWAIKYVSGILIEDMKMLVVLFERNSRTRVLTQTEVEMKDFILDELQPMIRYIQVVGFLFMSMYGGFVLVTVFWDYAFLFFPILYPLNFISWGFASTIVLLSTRVKFKRSGLSTRSALTQNVSSPTTATTHK